MPLMTGKSVPHPHGTTATGEEIVRARRKRRGHVNPLVLGSNPSGPIMLLTRNNNADLREKRFAGKLRHNNTPGKAGLNRGGL